ncbi:sulfatase-like hydrolase/transferase [Methylomonas sp. MO1]|uniref:sulfatase-like hydrolase/transferase n=1 Tax=unclassified Methylomonas TaxID=2608980 RepID=UPI0004BCACD7|nr:MULTISPECIES: sulfatase-like hydrolase/transferase [unclassified Methylomonas]MDT4292023.1 sulfatase-like hydrolase/transferase [Methylomonas sp. MO1]
MPNRLSAITPAAFAYLPLEAIVLGLALLVRGRGAVLIRWLAVGLLGTGIIMKLADIAAYQVFDRPFNPVLDSRFPADGMHLLQGAIGKSGAIVVAGLIVALLIGIFLLTNTLLRRVQRLLQGSARISGFVLCASLLVWSTCVFSGWPYAGKPFYDLLAQHVASIRTGMADLESFNNVVDSDPYAAVPDSALFEKLKGKDVLVVFVESYGRTVLDKADYAAHIRPLLQQSSAALAASGLTARSAYLSSPTYGGISWLAHGTLMSGLWINSQTRYDRLVMSQRPSLNRLFQRAGWRTVAVQPAHTMDWPQGEYFGYDRIYAAQDLSYKGQTFNWITMPDQYTLSSLQALERKPGARQPLMAELALISSHAPWTPLPELVDWDQVGDGSVFNQARVGDTPEEVWQNTERIREQYRKSIEYALANIVSYAITYGDDNLVILVLGDHQPAPFVTGESDSHDVLVHLISRDSKLMAAVDAWHWTDGMLPADNAPVLGMDKLRERFIRAFSQ